MKKRYLVIFLLLALMIVCLAACNGKDDYEGQAKITFELEGGDYNNCKLPVVHYYDIPEGQSAKISDMVALSKGELTRTGYQLEGWYTTKNANGTYSNRWNFDSDTVRAGEELTLYANWEVPIRHSYVICYIDEETGNKEVIDSISAQEGAVCDLTRVAQRAQRDGYSIVDYLDADGNLWDENFRHPGGEEDLAIEVYVKYIEGDYTVVKSADDLGGYGNIYLARDIDMGGAKLNLTSFTGGVIEGNGYTISNFVIDYSAGRYDVVPDFYEQELKCVNISLFGTLENATINNVTFDNYSVDVSTSYSGIDKIYVCPLSGTITGSTLNNVKAINFTFTYSRLPNGFLDDDNNLDTSKLVIVTDRFACVIDDTTKIEGDSAVIQTVAPQD